MDNSARRLAGGVVVVEGAALVLLCFGYAVSLLLGAPHNRGLALVGAALGIAAGAALVALGQALRAGAGRAAWSPCLLAQLLALPVGVALAQGGLVIAAAAVLVPSALALVLLLAGVPRPTPGE